jgi:hypothetical protein
LNPRTSKACVDVFVEDSVSRLGERDCLGADLQIKFGERFVGARG